MGLTVHISTVTPLASTFPTPSSLHRRKSLRWSKRERVWSIRSSKSVCLHRFQHQSCDQAPFRVCADSMNRASKFASLTSVTLFFPRNCSEGEEDSTRIYYIGLRGKWNPVSFSSSSPGFELSSKLLMFSSQLPNRPGVIIYESAARPTDHKMEAVSSSQAWKPGY